jgi:general stress protein YciG
MGAPDPKNPSGEEDTKGVAAVPTADETTQRQEAEHGDSIATSSADKAAPAEKPKQRRGFAAMDRSKVRAIAMLGGAAVHRKGTAHRFSHEEAREAGRKGGLAPHRVRGRKLPTEDEPEKTPPPPSTEES